MTSAEMIVELRSRLDEKPLTDKLITLAEKYEKLNDSALFLANNLDADRHLQSLIGVAETFYTVTEVLSMTIPSDFLKFHDVYDATSTSTRHHIARMVDPSMGPVLRNQYNRPPEDVLTCAFDGNNKLFTYNETLPSALAWRYVKEPDAISSSSEVDLADRYHDLLLDYAEYLCWVQLDDAPRGDLKLNAVMAQIKRLNPKQEEVKS